MTGSTANQSWVEALPAAAGIGLRAPHLHELLGTKPALEWVEVHSENYFGRGIPLHHLLRVRDHYAVSLHGVGLSVGSTDALKPAHLAQLKSLIEAVEPVLVSEHLSWSSVGGRFLNDLLPLPYTEEALNHVTERVLQTQEQLGRQILIENISSYLQLCESAIPEWEFLAALAECSGCGILLDINNIYVSAANHGFDARQYLRSVPTAHVKEMHLAGFTHNRFEDGEILIDSHNQRVAPAVWQLYAEAVGRFGPTPTLIEWDTNLPELGVLLDEARIAKSFLVASREIAA